MLTLLIRNHIEELNTHFSNIRKNISTKIDPPSTTFNDFLSESFSNLCSFPPTSADEISLIMSPLKMQDIIKHL